MCRFPGYQTVHLCTVVALSLSRDVFQTPRTGEWHGGIPCASSTTIIYSRCWVFRRMRLCKMVLRSVDVGIFLQDAQPDSRPRWRHRSWWRRPRWDLPAAEMQLATDVGPLSVDPNLTRSQYLPMLLGAFNLSNHGEFMPSKRWKKRFIKKVDRAIFIGESKLWFHFTVLGV